jgi:hypothetical protein
MQMLNVFYRHMQFLSFLSSRKGAPPPTQWEGVVPHHGTSNTMT